MAVLQLFRGNSIWAWIMSALQLDFSLCFSNNQSSVESA